MSFCSSDSLSSSGMASLNKVRGMSGSAAAMADSAMSDIYDHVQATLGEKRYKQLKQSTSLRLKNLYIRRSSLLRRSREKEAEKKGDCKKGLLNHDSVIVELHDISDGSIVHILAEKTGADDKIANCRSGIHIYVDLDFCFNPDQDKKIECDELPISLPQVQKILRTPSSNYDLITANCWQYVALVVHDFINTLRGNAKGNQKLEKVYKKYKKHLKATNTVLPSCIRIGLASIAAIGIGCTVASIAIVGSMTTNGGTINLEDADDE